MILSFMNKFCFSHFLFYFGLEVSSPLKLNFLRYHLLLVLADQHNFLIFFLHIRPTFNLTKIYDAHCMISHSGF